MTLAHCRFSRNVPVVSHPANSPGMLRPRGLCGLEAKLFGLGLVASGVGLIEVGLVASKFALTNRARI